MGRQAVGPGEPLKISLSAIGDFLVNWVISQKKENPTNQHYVTKAIITELLLSAWEVSQVIMHTYGVKSEPHTLYCDLYADSYSGTPPKEAPSGMNISSFIVRCLRLPVGLVIS